jgi:hypothetical protein
MMRRAGLLVLAFTLGACRSAADGRAPSVATVTPIFGPVIGAEVIGGRADAGNDILLLAGGTDLVRVDIGSRVASRARLSIGPSAECWNLARLTDGSLWTLKGRRSLARIDPDGAIVSETTLADAHFGLFAAGDRLLFQRADFTPPAPALLAGAAGDPSRSPWSAIRTREFPSLARASVAALNMVTCGATQASERACWFPDEAAVSLVKEDGATRRVTLPGLAVVAAETLLTSDNPSRPVRDAYVDEAGRVWILSSGTPPAPAADIPGGWVLARFSPDGAPEGQARLPEAVRLILRVTKGSVVVLTSTGMVAEVSRW